jgi:hypothetical protein
VGTFYSKKKELFIDFGVEMLLVHALAKHKELEGNFPTQFPYFIFRG